MKRKISLLRQLAISFCHVCSSRLLWKVNLFPKSRSSILYYSHIASEDESDRIEEAFEREYDEDEFEEKITRLTRAALHADTLNDSGKAICGPSACLKGHIERPASSVYGTGSG